MKVIAATYNNQGNLIISTCADQRVSDLLQYAEDFLPLIDQGYKTSTVEERKFNSERQKLVIYLNKIREEWNK